VTKAQLFEGAALADGLSPVLRRPVSVLIADGIVTGIFDSEVPAEARAGARVIDASGATIVPSFVACHSHLTLQGGAQWVARGADDRLRGVRTPKPSAIMKSGACRGQLSWAAPPTAASGWRTRSPEPSRRPSAGGREPPRVTQVPAART